MSYAQFMKAKHRQECSLSARLSTDSVLACGVAVSSESCYVCSSDTPRCRCWARALTWYYVEQQPELSNATGRSVSTLLALAVTVAVLVWLINSNQLIKRREIYDASGCCNLRWSRHVKWLAGYNSPHSAKRLAICQPMHAGQWG